MIVINFKVYPRSIEQALYFVDVIRDVVEETGIRIIPSPPVTYLREASDRFSDVFSQFVDYNGPGAHTGSLTALEIKTAGARGSLLNHSEKRLSSKDKVKASIEQLHLNGLESIVCAESPEECKEFAEFKPTYIAVEPPELIGTGISVSKAKPEIIEGAVNNVKEISDIPVLCGAGVSNKEDVRSAIRLGAEGVLLASAFIKAKDPKEFLRDLASVF